MSSHSPVEPFASAEDWERSRALLWNGSRTFMSASRLLPARVREAAVGLYAFCRTADDAVDGGDDAVAAINALRIRIDDIYAGRPRYSADRTFADVIVRYSIPRTYPDALLEGLEWDSLGRRYNSLDDLNAYAMRVAGVVGAMMALVMGVRDRARVARACDLGVAMQLTNIARDVGEDARNGRIYLPLDWLRDAGIDASTWLSSPSFDPRLAAVIERLLLAADGLYRRSESGLHALPAACRTGMFAARYLYASIGDEVCRLGFDSVQQRAVVRTAAKGRLLCKALFAAVGGASEVNEGMVLAQAAFVLHALPVPVPVPLPLPMPMPPDAADAVDAASGAALHLPLSRRVDGVFDLFERLGRRDGSRAAAEA